jgi:hypothetical protein
VTPGGQIFLIDHADLPLKTVRARGATHASLVATAGGSRDATVPAPADDVTGQAREEAEAR